MLLRGRLTAGVARRCLLLCLAFWAVSGCEKGKPGGSDTTTGADTSDADAVAPSDTTSGNDTGSDVLTIDLPLTDDVLTCPGSDGCTCNGNSECTSGFCAETVAGMRCAPLCSATCPPGTACKSTAGEPVSFCAPLGVRECAPCEVNADCNGPNSMPSSCVATGNGGSFCATVCQIGADCPEGSICGVVPGQAGKVCVPSGGLAACSCSAWAKAAGASTRCAIPDGTLSCPGTRKCAPDGLTTCELVPNEVCVDVGCADAKDGSACDDSDPCTADSTCKAGVCQGGVGVCECQTSEDCKGKEDGNICNGTLYCESSTHTCKVNPQTVITCPKPSGACEVATCDAKTGACGTELLPDNAACDDNKSCTVGDYCSAGKCVSGTVTCVCDSNDDCDAYEDGNACNGTLFCNKVKGQCQVNPATVVVCPSGLDTTCVHNVCEPTTGACSLALEPTTTLCDDGNPCTASDHCSAGTCSSNVDVCPCDQDGDCATQEDNNLCNGTLYCDLLSKTCKINPKTVVTCAETSDNPCAPIECNPQSGKCQASPVLAGACDDGDPCTAPGNCAAGQCMPGPSICQCKTADDCLAFDDGNACNGQYYCDTKAGECKINPATIVTCPAGSDSCESNVCNPDTGTCEVQFAPDGAQCEDGIGCTSGDACLSGTCKPASSTCGCFTDAECTGKDDGNLCNGTWYCDKGEGKYLCAFNPNSVVQCNQSGLGACEQRVCEPATGACLTSNKPSSCSDGDVCTEGDTCVDKACKPGTAVDCGDDTACRDFYCQTVGNVGCTFSNLTATCSDGDACTTGDKCAGGNCISGSATNCPDDGNGCTTESCDTLIGCVTLQPTTPCDDGNACTEGDACDAGGCQPGPAKDCDDKNVCTADACAPATGCTHVSIKSGCDDGEWCTTGDSCSGTTCVGSDRSCDDGEFCTLDHCEHGGPGCQYTWSDNNCDDGNACTVGDYCSAGTCQTGSVTVDCDDHSACSTESCQPEQGCVYSYLLTECVTDADCGEGYCDSKWCVLPHGACSDGDPCTADSCDAQTGCIHTPASGATCSDLAPCYENGVCNAGLCVGKPKSCDDGNPCTADSCDVATNACASEVLSDGTSCDDDNSCTTDDTCNSGTCAGTDVLAAKVWTGGNVGKQDEVDALVALSDSDVFFAVSSWTDDTNRWGTKLVRVQNGVQTWSWQYDGEQDDLMNAGLYAWGKVWFAGRSRALGMSFVQGWLVSVDPTTLSVVEYRYGSDDSYFAGIAKTSSGLALAGSLDSQSEGIQGWLQTTDSSGLPQTSKTFGDTAVDDYFSGVAVSGSRVGLIGTRRVGCCSSDVWFVGTTTAGVLTAERTFGSEGYDLGFNIAEVSNGWLLGASVSGAPYATDADSWTLRLNYAGQLMWQRAHTQSGDQYPAKVAVQRAANGSTIGLVYTGFAFDEGGAAFLTSVDTVGNERWTRWFGTNNAEDAGRAIGFSDHHIFLGGYADSGGERDAVLYAGDAFGRDSCSESKGCSSKTLAACTDAEPCTVDDCNAGSCAWTTLDETARCDDGLPCTMNDTCTGGSCKPGPLADYDGDGQAPELCGGADCDDANDLVGQGFLEICDGNTVDNDCDGLASDTLCSCPTSWQALTVDSSAGAKTCAALGPVWGKRATSSAAYFVWDDTNQVVTDRQTKLTWAAANVATSYANAVNVCSELTQAGYSDWRMPTWYELWTVWWLSSMTGKPFAYMFEPLLVLSSGNPVWAWALPTGHLPSVTYIPYALSTTSTTASTAAAWCVRGGTSPTSSSQGVTQSATDGWYTHHATGFVWAEFDAPGAMSQAQASQWCLSLSTATRQWRLPHAVELLGLNRPHVGADFSFLLPGMSAVGYWSLTPSPGGGWVVATDDATIHDEAPTANWGVRCVSANAACGNDDDCDNGDGVQDYCDPFTKTCSHSYVAP